MIRISTIYLDMGPLILQVNNYLLCKPKIMYHPNKNSIIELNFLFAVQNKTKPRYKLTTFIKTEILLLHENNIIVLTFKVINKT